MPTPSRNRSSHSTAMLAACLATSTTGRTASFNTKVVKRIAFGARREVGDERERLDDRLVLEERAVAVGRVRVERVRLGREDQAVGHDERVVARVLGRLRERREERGIAEGLGVAESHGRDLARRGSVRRHRPVHEIGAACEAELRVAGAAEGRRARPNRRRPGRSSRRAARRRRRGRRSSRARTWRR